MFAIRITLLIVLFKSDWFSRGCDDDGGVLETFVFIENSTYTVESPGDEFLFRAHFSTRLRPKERQFVIYFIDPLTYAAAVLKNRSFCSTVGYGLIEETLSIQKDGILLLKIFLCPHPILNDVMLDSLFALTIVNVTEPAPPLTEKELKKANIINQNLPWVDMSIPGVVFPGNGKLEIETIQSFENAQDGLMQNNNYAIMFYNNHALSNHRGLPINVLAYKKKYGLANVVRQCWSFFFLTFKNIKGLFIKYLPFPGWRSFPYFSFNNDTGFPYVIMYPRKYDQFSPLEGRGRVLDEKVDPNREYFFDIQLMRRNLYKKKGFSAFQGCDEGEFIPFDYEGKLNWGVIKNGTKRVVNTNTWTYEVGGHNVNALLKENNFSVTLLIKECMHAPTTESTTKRRSTAAELTTEKRYTHAESTTKVVNPAKNVQLEDRETFLRFIWKLHDYPPSFITVKHEIYLPVVTVVIIVTLLITIGFLIFIRGCITKNENRASNINKNEYEK